MFRLELRLASSLFLVGGLWALPGSWGMAQSNIVPDQSLGAERSRVIPNAGGLPREEIQGGAQRGANLFHSFRNFSIEAGRGAFFANPAGVANILSRVTGRNLSDINGTLGVLGNADFFLINPNGILFGPNASLDLSGSFLASTASKITFPDGRDFDAQVGQEPAVLSINVPQGLQWGNQSAPVTVQGSSLSVQEGQSLALAGGNVQIEDGDLEAPGGRIELGGINTTGVVGLNMEGNQFRLSFPEDISLADVSLDNGALVDVSADGSGSISINADQVKFSDSSDVNAEIDEGLGEVDIQAVDTAINIKANSLQITDGSVVSASNFGQGRAGNIEIDVRDQIFLDGQNEDDISSKISNRIERDSIGEGGNVELSTNSLLISNGAFISTSNLGSGNQKSGDVTINAHDNVSLIGVGTDVPSGIFSQVLARAVGDSGAINLTVVKGSLSITDGAEIITETRGLGNAANIEIDVRDEILLDGEGPVERANGSGINSSGVFSRIAPSGEGKGGDIELSSSSLIVQNGAFISTSNDSDIQGDAGNINIRVRENVSLRGVGDTSSSISSQILRDAKGDAGNINLISAEGSLFVTEGAEINTTVLPNTEGDAGTITINAPERIVLNGVGTVGTDINSSGIFSGIRRGAQGNAGSISLSTSSLLAQNGAFISTSSGGQGDAGTVVVNAQKNISLSGFGSDGFPSGIYSQTRARGGQVGNGQAGTIILNVPTGLISVSDEALVSTLTSQNGQAGNITLIANTLEAINGGQVVTNTERNGNAGSINLNISDNILLAGSAPTYFERLDQSGDNVSGVGPESGLFANTSGDSTGDSGSIVSDLQTVQTTIQDGAKVAVDNQGTGIGGDISLRMGSLTLNEGTISAQTASNSGGDITLDIANLLLLRNNSSISATAGTRQAGGDGGDIDIDTALLVAFPLENSDITADAFEGNGGNIQITAQGFFGTEFRDQLTPLSDITASSTFATDGTVQLDTSLDPTSGLVDLPVQPPQPQQVAQTCTPGGSGTQSEFVYTGRGGLPPAPQQVLNQPEIETDWVGLAPHTNRENQSQSQPKNIPENQAPTPSLLSPELSSDALSLSKTSERGLSDDALSLSKTTERRLSGDALSLSKGVEAKPLSVNKQTPATPQIVEAQGWVSTDDGKVLLTSSTTTPPYHLSQKVCPSR